MSNIDKQVLNQEKIEWLNKLADMEYCKSNPGHWLMSLKDTNMLAKLALRSVALLDELEDYKAAYEEEYREKEVQRSVIDDALCKLLPGCQYMDLPDGGSVTPLEQVSRMIADYLEQLQAAEKRISELEASHNNLREAMAGIHNTIAGGGAYTPLAAILNASKRAYEESAAAAGKGEAS
ncbi:TPA: hypothetical protein ACG1QI_003917 [Enterobacter kobei]